jgi:hypothetical protein
VGAHDPTKRIVLRVSDVNHSATCTLRFSTQGVVLTAAFRDSKGHGYGQTTAANNFALSTCLGMMTRRLSRSGFAGIGSKGDGAPLFAGGSTGDPTQIICPVLQSFYRVLKYRGSAYHVPHLYSMVYSS